jgi:hypothetical protein
VIFFLGFGSGAGSKTLNPCQSRQLKFICHWDRNMGCWSALIELECGDEYKGFTAAGYAVGWQSLCGKLMGVLGQLTILRKNPEKYVDI